MKFFNGPAPVLFAAALALTAGPAAAQTSRPVTEAEKAEIGAIARHVNAHGQGGVFSIFDTRTGRPLALKLVSIHTTSHPMPSGETFFCADFTDMDGVPYDLDFYVKGSGESAAVVESFIHMADGKDRIRPAADAEAVDGATAAKVREALAAHWSEGMKLTDAREGKMLDLKFDNVHETVKALPDGTFFACIDARGADGVLYDLDSFVKMTTAGVKVVETLIHQKDGVERLRNK